MAGCAGGIVWVVGIFLSAEAGGVLPSDAEYFWLGAVGGALGLLVIPIALFSPGDRALRVGGLVIALATSASGVVLMLGAAGHLGERAPGWIVPASTASLFVLLAWMSVTSYRGRDPRSMGKAVFVAGLIIAAALISGLAAWFFPYSHTDGTAPIDLLIALLVIACVPVWFVAVSIRLWSGTGPSAQ